MRGPARNFPLDWPRGMCYTYCIKRGMPQRGDITRPRARHRRMTTMHISNDLERATRTAEVRRQFPKLNTFRDCFEAGMDVDTALGCSGLSEVPEITVAMLKRQWVRWEARFENGEGA